MNIALQTSRYNNLSFSSEIEFALTNSSRIFDIFFDGFFPENLTESEITLLEKALLSGLKLSVHLPIKKYLCESDIPDSIVNFINTYKPLTTTVHFNEISYKALSSLGKRISHSTILSVENTIPDYNLFTHQNFYDFIFNFERHIPISITYDIGHAAVNGYNPEEYINKLLSTGVQISTVHVHDNDGKKDLHQAAGTGVLQLNTIINKLYKLNKEIVFVTEHWDDNLKTYSYIQNSILN